MRTTSEAQMYAAKVCHEAAESHGEIALATIYSDAAPIVHALLAIDQRLAAISVLLTQEPEVQETGSSGR